MRTRSQAFGLRVALIVGVAVRLTPAAHAQPAFQVKDIGTALSPGSSGITGTVFDGALYFSSWDGIHGHELWRTDGTRAGTWLVKDLCPGICSASLVSIVTFRHRLYFSAQDGEHRMLFVSDGTPEGTAPAFGSDSPAAARDLMPIGEVGGELLLSGLVVGQPGGELWKTDGTAAGTVLLRTFHGSFLISRPLPQGQLGDIVLFTAEDQGPGATLWRTDGTAQGTVPLYPGILFSNQYGASTYGIAGGRLFFQANRGEAPGLWVSDGTTAGTYRLNFNGRSSGTNAVLLGSELFFDGYENGGEGRYRLWKSDGTDAGTVIVKELQETVLELTAVGDHVFWLNRKLELWASDGTESGTRQLVQFPAGKGISSTDLLLFPFKDKIVFLADDGIHGREPWWSDGTPAGTRLLADFNPGPGGSAVALPPGPGVLNGRWFFAASTPKGVFLWATDGTKAGTSRVRRLDFQTPSWNQLQADLGGALLFSTPDAAGGADLWRSDGSEAGTLRIKHVDFGVSPLAEIRGRLLFGSGYLWTTDGTAAGTEPVRDTAPLSYSGATTSAQIGRTLFLAARSPKRAGLFRTDGQAAGTVFLHRFDWATYSPPPRQFTAADGRLFFIVGQDEERLWKSDGTVAGTTLVVPTGPDPAALPFHHPDRLTAVRSRLFFAAQNESGVELWTSDGTAAGTHLVKDILPGPGSGFDVGWHQGSVSAAGRLFFVGDDGVHGRELWTSDGTAAGTFMVKDIVPGAATSEMRDLTPLGQRVFFSAADGVHGRELWVSDGTAAGTHLVRDLLPGPASAQPQALKAIDGLLLFAAYDGIHGVEPWVSDGTAAGTRMLQDIAPGALPSSPEQFLSSGPYVYFQANDGSHGFELWALPRAALPTPQR